MRCDISLGLSVNCTGVHGPERILPFRLFLYDFSQGRWRTVDIVCIHALHEEIIVFNGPCILLYLDGKDLDTSARSRPVTPVFESNHRSTVSLNQ
jgi:hypothetical protein